MAFFGVGSRGAPAANDKTCENVDSLDSLLAVRIGCIAPLHVILH